MDSGRYTIVKRDYVYSRDFGQTQAGTTEKNRKHLSTENVFLSGFSVYQLVTCL